MEKDWCVNDAALFTKCGMIFRSCWPIRLLHWAKALSRQVDIARMKAKRLLFVGPWPPPFGGIASHLQSVVPLLKNDGYEPFVLNIAQFDAAREEHGILIEEFSISAYVRRNPFQATADMVRCSGMMEGFSPRDRLKYAAFSRKVARHIKVHAIDAVFFYEIYRAFTLPLLRGLHGVSIPAGVMSFGEGFEAVDYYAAKKRYLAKVAGQAQMLFASSRYCAASAGELWGGERQINIVYVGVDVSRFAGRAGRDEMRARLGISPNATLCTFLGRMKEDMGLDAVIDAAPRILNGNPSACLLMAGARDQLSEKAEALAAREPRVKYFPDVPGKDIVAVYAASDVFLAPTRDNHACMGVSIKEAMAAGLPVVATDTCGVPEAVMQGETGYLVPLKGERADIAALVERTVELCADAGLRERFGKAAYRRALDIFDEKATLKRYLEMLDHFG